MTKQSQSLITPINLVTYALFLRVSILAAVIAAAASCSAAQDQGQVKPNVVIIFTDDQGTLDANCFGSTDLHTPAIDSLAREGVRFTQAYAHTVCCPARAMLLTGRHPQRSNVNTWVQERIHGPDSLNMRASEVTLAEALRAAGYQTALYGKWHLGAHRNHEPTKQGFDEFFGFHGGYIDNYVHFRLHRLGFHDLYEGRREVFHRGQYFPDLIVDRAISFIERNQNVPFFLYFALNIPHYPEQSLERHRRRYRAMEEPRRSYAATISTVDEYVGRILTQLEARGLRERTIIVFMSDNGHSEEDVRVSVDNHLSGYPKGHNFGPNGGGGNTGKWIGAKGSFLEGGIRVPAIVSYPQRLPRNVVRDQAVTAMDWYPTILDLAGIEPPKGVQLDGHNLLPLIEDRNAPSPYRLMHWQWQQAWAVRQGDWKLIVNGKLGITSPPLADVHLGHLAEERPEQKNHARQQPEIVGRLKQLHAEWAARVTRNDPL